jgi:hypothetical protein
LACPSLTSTPHCDKKEFTVSDPSYSPSFDETGPFTPPEGDATNARTNPRAVPDPNVEPSLVNGLDDETFYTSDPAEDDWEDIGDVDDELDTDDELIEVDELDEDDDELPDLDDDELDDDDELEDELEDILGFGEGDDLEDDPDEDGLGALADGDDDDDDDDDDGPDTGRPGLSDTQPL